MAASVWAVDVCRSRLRTCCRRTNGHSSAAVTGPSLGLAPDRADGLAVVNGLGREKAWRVQAVLELGAVARCAGAIEEATEILQQRVRAAQRDEREAIRSVENTAGFLKSAQKSRNAFSHSSSVTLTVKFLLTWPASFRMTPAPFRPSTRKSSARQPRCSV